MKEEATSMQEQVTAFIKELMLLAIWLHDCITRCHIMSKIYSNSYAGNGNSIKVFEEEEVKC